MKRYLKISPGHVSGRILLKSLIFLSAALLVTSCGEKSSSEGFDSAGASAEPSADTTQESEKPITVPLSDADVERILKEAVDFDSLEKRDDLVYQDNKPYSGWIKKMYDSGQVSSAFRAKDGKWDFLMIEWHENGQKSGEGTLKDGRPHGLVKVWHKNGQKALEGTFKDGEEVSVTYWNSTGEEVETEEEAYK